MTDGWWDILAGMLVLLDVPNLVYAEFPISLGYYLARIIHQASLLPGSRGKKLIQSSIMRDSRILEDIGDR